MNSLLALLLMELKRQLCSLRVCRRPIHPQITWFASANEYICDYTTITITTVVLTACKQSQERLGCSGYGRLSDVRIANINAVHLQLSLTDTTSINFSPHGSRRSSATDLWLTTTTFWRLSDSHRGDNMRRNTSFLCQIVNGLLNVSRRRPGSFFLTLPIR